MRRFFSVLAIGFRVRRVTIDRRQRNSEKEIDLRVISCDAFPQGLLPSPSKAIVPMSSDISFLNQLLGIVPPEPKTTGITFGARRFTEPTLHRSAIRLAWPGLYAILVYDFRCWPRPYRVIYFGQAEDLHARVTDTHEKYGAWCNAASGSSIYVAFRWMLSSTEEQRVAEEARLIRDYCPQCNDTFNPLSALLGHI